MAVTDPAARADAIAWRHDAHARVCNRFEPWVHGTVVWADEFPTYYDFNTLRLEGPDPGIGAAALAAEADRIQAPLAHRKVEIEDAAAGERLRPGLEALGWRVGRLLWMVHDGPPPLQPEEQFAVQEVARRDIRELRLEWVEHFTVEQMIAFEATQDAVEEREGVRAAALRGSDGDPIAYTTWKAGPVGGEVVNVFVRESERGRGLGRALTAWTTARAFASGAPRVWIVADDEYHAKHLYAALGFKPAWIQHECIRHAKKGTDPFLSPTSR